MTKNESCQHPEVKDVCGEITDDEQTGTCSICDVPVRRYIDDVLYLAYLGWDGEFDTKFIGRVNGKDVWATRWERREPANE